MTDLKLCPFCGGEDLEIDHAPTYDVHHPDCYEVHCVECGGRGGEGWTEAEAIAAWNSRAERTCLIVDRQEDWQYNFGVKDYEFSCGHTIGWAHTYEPNYCPNCGAKVVGA